MTREEKAKDWLLSMQQEDGSVIAGEAEDKQYPYMEITGYFLKFALKYDLLPEATNAANCLVKCAQNGFVSWNGTDPYTYSFDTCIMADALLDFFEYSYQSRYYNTASMMMTRITAMERQLGHIPTMFSRDGRAWNDPSVYYGIPAAHYLKLIPIFQRFGYETHYLERFLNLQRGDGGFHCSPQTRYIMAHFHAYSLDGLENYEKYGEEYEKGALWAKHNLMGKEDYRVPAWSSDRSWSMLGANLQLAYHLNNVGEKALARKIRDRAMLDQNDNGGIPIRDGKESEVWPSLFLFLYNF